MRKVISIIILVALALVAGGVYWFYFNRYGNGYREGILYSFQRKGNIFKTYEGVIIQPGLRPLKQGGLNTNEFYFSVEDPALADSLEQITGMQIKVHYQIYRKHLPWRGDNYNDANKERGQHIVDDILSATPAVGAYHNF